MDGEEIEVIEGDIFKGEIEPNNQFFHLAEVDILPPVQPSSMLALAKNYGSHLQGDAPPKQPEPFYKTLSS